jgi:excisionase family DNA binding protein
VRKHGAQTETKFPLYSDLKLYSPVFSVSPAVLYSLGMNTQLSPILVTIKDAANLLSVCPRTVQNLIVAKKLKVRKVGRRTLLSYRELLTFAQHDHSTAAPEQQ